MYITYIAILITISFSSNLFAKERQVGINISSISGSGLSYHTQINKDVEIRATGFLYYTSDGESKDIDKAYIFGSELQYNLSDNRDNRLYLFLGTSFWYLEKEMPRSVKINDKLINYTLLDINRVWNFGTGIGYEISILDIAKLDLGIGFQYQNSGISKVSTYIDRSPSGTNFIGIGGSLGLRIVL